MGLNSRKEARLRKLRDVISERHSVHVKDAAEFLNVSEMTVRRDIRENPQDFGYLGGYIVLANGQFGRTPYNLENAANTNEEAKKKACAYCLSEIKSKDTVFVDCGTTLVHFIDMLPLDIEISLVCYALNIADRAIRNPKIKLIMIGGEYHPATASFAPLGNDNMFDSLAIDTGFFTAAGIDPKLGATCPTFHEANQKQAAMEKCQRRILVVDNSKVGKIHPACFSRVSEFDRMITENGNLEFDPQSHFTLSS